MKDKRNNRQTAEEAVRGSNGREAIKRRKFKLKLKISGITHV